MTDHQPLDPETPVDRPASQDPELEQSTDAPASVGDKVLGDKVLGDKVLGDKVLGNKIIQQDPDAPYTVSGLSNPYLGLLAYTYEERLLYGGREELVKQTVRLLTAPGSERALLFVTGASGSGKSSFVQAGLLPALEQFYAGLERGVRWQRFQPSQKPMYALARALLALGLPLEGPFSPAAPYALPDAPKPAPTDQICVLVIDQFEELFTQSLPDQRNALLAWLESLPAFPDLRMHVIATVRADYLPNIFEHEQLYALAKQGVDLWVMKPEQLRRAIREPLEQTYPQGDKYFEPALLDRLTEDAARDSSYLPLLQVTLEQLWNGGRLKLSEYHGLANAIQKHADEVLAVAQDEQGRLAPRNEAEQAAVLGILLDLVEVTLDEDVERSVRRRRRLDALIADQPGERQLVNELVRRRLLAAGVEVDQGTKKEMQVIDLIHESLIANWPRLRVAITFQHDVLQRRVRFENALRDWLGNDRDKKRLLQGVGLDEAAELERAHDVALQSKDGRMFWEKSWEAEKAHRRTRRLITGAIIATLSALLLVALGLAGFASMSAQQATDAKSAALQAQATAEAEATRALAAEARARSGELAAQAVAQLNTDPELGILLALESISSTQSTQVMSTTQPTERSRAEDALRQALIASDAVATFAHNTGVFALAISPDGRYLISGDDRAIYVRDVTTEELVDSWTGVDAYTSRAAYHPAGIQVATAHYTMTNGVITDTVIRLWDPETGAVTQRLPGHTAYITDLEYSNDGKRLASASADSTARIWDTVSGQGVMTFAMPSTGVVWSVAFSPDGSSLATAGADGIARIWDVGTRREVMSYTHSSSDLPVLAVSFGPTGTGLLATAGQDLTIKVWEVGNTTRPRATLRGHTNNLEDLDFNATGSRLVSAGEDGMAIIWDTSDVGNGVPEVERLKGHRSGIFVATYDPSGTMIATGSLDGTAKLWAVAAHDDGVIDIDVDPTASGRVVTAGLDDRARIWRFAEGRLNLLFTLQHEGDVFKAVFSPDGKIVATASKDGKARLWDSSDGALLHVLENDAQSVNSVSFSPDGLLVATGSDDQTARLWDVQTGKQLRAFAGHQDSVNDVAFSPDGELLAVAVNATTNSGGQLWLWRVANGRKAGELIGHRGDVDRVLFSPDGTRIVTTDAGAAMLGVRIWDATTRQVVTNKQAPHTGRVFGLDVDPVGTRLISAGTDGIVVVWDLNKGQVLEHILHSSDPIWDAAISADGRFAFLATSRGMVEIQALVRGALEEQARRRVTRPWRTEECQRIFSTATCPPTLGAAGSY